MEVREEKDLEADGGLPMSEKDQDVMSEYVSSLDLDANALEVLKRRYLARDEEGRFLETPEDLFKRVAKNIAQADKQFNEEADLEVVEKRFYEMMTKLEFLPNSPTLFNAGRELQELSACFVLPIEDSMESIFDTIKHTALIHKSGGGTGFSFSRLRPKQDRVKGTMGVSSGPISFMEVFNSATEAIKQGGARRGANMGILKVDHPDIEDFIKCKANNDTLNNFNISVGLTEDFMKAWESGDEYELKNPRNGEIMGTRDARKIFRTIAEMAHKNGEPGIVFLDRINEHNPTPEVGEIESTNPCGEQPLLPYESCNLGSINLVKFVKDGDVEWDRLADTVHEAVHFLDNVISMNRFPLPQIEDMTKANRKIGLGVMGWADMLIKLCIPYNSRQALTKADRLMAFIQTESIKASRKLAKERGAFPNWEKSVYAKKKRPLQRNATTTTIAPTGSIGLIADASGGIEPLFAVSYIRANILDNAEMAVVNKHFESVAKKRGFYSDELMKTIAKKGSLQGIKEVPKDVRRVFVTAHDIPPEWHIKMQAAFQRHIDNAVSKTINFPNSASVDAIEKAYLLAYDSECKGITVYRNGSRDAQVLNIGKPGSGKGAKPGAITIRPRPRPSMIKGSTVKVNTGCGPIYVTINEDEEGLFEVFTQMGKSGGCAQSHSEATSRLISLALRSGLDTGHIMKQLRGIRCPSPLPGRGGMVLSCSDAIAKAMDDHLKAKTSEFVKEETTLDKFIDPMELSNVVGMCPDCGNALIAESGCMTCRSCGYSKCA